MNKEPQEETVEYPFIIHADWMVEQTAFPTHTHGLAAIGMPEFFLDPAAFGPVGNCTKINLACEFFSRPENAAKLDAVLRGAIVKLHSTDLDPGIHEDYVFCFREVPHEFEGVKLAYPDEIGIEEMRFVQIWVEGDDYALEDDYYKGGVRW